MVKPNSNCIFEASHSSDVKSYLGSKSLSSAPEVVSVLLLSFLLILSSSVRVSESGCVCVGVSESGRQIMFNFW